MARAKQLFVCIDNDGYRASLEKRKVYVALRDLTAEKHDLVQTNPARIISSKDIFSRDRITLGH